MAPAPVWQPPGGSGERRDGARMPRTGGTGDQLPGTDAARARPIAVRSSPGSLSPLHAVPVAVPPHYPGNWTPKRRGPGAGSERGAAGGVPELEGELGRFGQKPEADCQHAAVIVRLLE